MCSRSLRLEPSALLLDVTGPSKRLLNSFGVSGETFVLELKESNPKGEWDSLLSTDLSDPDSFVSSFAFCVAKSASQCKADDGAVSGQSGLLVFTSPVLLVGNVSVFADSSILLSVASDFGAASISICPTPAVPAPVEKVFSFPETDELGFTVGSCDIPLVTAGLNTDLFCRLIHGQLALIPHLPRAA